MTRASLIALLRERHCKWATREVEAMGLHVNNLKWLYYGVPGVMGACLMAMLILGVSKDQRPIMSISMIGVAMAVTVGVLSRCGAAIAVLVDKKPDRQQETAAVVRSQYESLLAIANDAPWNHGVFHALLGASDELERISHQNVTCSAKHGLLQVREIMHEAAVEERN
ncbi:MAG: hypothetical protein BWZ07_02691 [Alphaproteobacteria bacterium ADurb.BinA280]|nr:MAG: hypothetical protein BWZ07_02691 [Alphaproteobacteria bacterium ADurb.BinA280]